MFGFPLGFNCFFFLLPQDCEAQTWAWGRKNSSRWEEVGGGPMIGFIAISPGMVGGLNKDIWRQGGTLLREVTFKLCPIAEKG
jgi:hypothetical protein